MADAEEQSLRGVHKFNGKTSLELLRDEDSASPISTLCTDLDEVLGGGIRTKEVTEVCGVPGIGKTQLGIQLAINVQVPRQLGGLDGHAVYIDSEGSFMVERALQMAAGCIELLRTPSQAVTDMPSVAEEFLEHIYHYRVHDSFEQQAVLYNLRKFLATHIQVKLVVVDSLTFHFRQDYEDMGARTRILSQIAQDLMQLSQEHDIAVVLVNQVLHRVSGQSSRLVPVLGDTWSHSCTNRVMLYWIDGCRYAHLYKSPSLPPATAAFEVRMEGIRNCSTTAEIPPKL